MRREGVGVMKDEDLKDEDIETYPLTHYVERGDA